MADLKDILSEKNEHASEEELVNYLDGKLSEEEKHAFENKTADSAFINDAVEGLHQFNNKQKLNEYVEQLNRNLSNQLDQRKKRKEKRRIKDNPWMWLAVIIILGLAILAYIIIRMQNEKTSQLHQSVQPKIVQEKLIWHEQI